MIKLLVVDDSAMVRRLISEAMGAHPDIQVIGAAEDPYAAREMILKQTPDVITLDVEMPRMDGLSFLSKLMKYKPVPTIIVSSVTPRGGEMALKALSLGAVDVVPKPGSTDSVPDIHRHLLQVVRAAALSRRHGAETVVEESDSPMDEKNAEPPPNVIVLGASTGGVHAIEEVLKGLTPEVSGIVIVQHLPLAYSASFAKRLAAVCPIPVKLAEDGQTVEKGTALLCPGGTHSLLENAGTGYRVRLKDGPRVHFQKPSVDVLFNSAAEKAGKDAAGVLLTGMGTDGARGLLALKEAGARTLAEAKETCVVFGMPAEALRLGAARRGTPLGRIAPALMRMCAAS